jgi:hypothetical protein
MRAFRLCCLFGIVAWSCSGQSDRGSITGRVVDPTDSLVLNAAVTVLSQDTAARTVVHTNRAGNYAVRELPFGKYEVSCEAPGFRRYIRNVELIVGQTLTLDFKLELGQVEQTVEVTTATPLLDNGTSELATVVDQKQVQDLPLSVSGNMRNPESFVLLAPGVTGDVTNTQINGSQSRGKEVLVDGAGSTSPESGGLLFTYPPLEAIGEFKLSSSVFSAEFGKTGGGFEIFTTRSGTNKYHGSAFEYLRNDKLDARGFIAQTTPVNRQNEFGASFGGPVILPKYNGRNRTFFYFVYDGFRYRAGATNSLSTVPSLKVRDGDFSGQTKGGKALIVYDPSTTHGDGAGGFTRDPFMNNVIPKSKMSKVSMAMLALFPTPNTSQATGNYFQVGAQVFDRNVYTVKADHAFSDRNHLSVFLYDNEQTSIAPEAIVGAMSPALMEIRPSHWIRINHDYQITPTTVNNFRAGYTRDPQIWSRITAGHGYLQQTGLSGVNPPGDVVPRVQFSDTYSNWADEVKNIGRQVNNTLQFADTVSRLQGNHNFKFGIDARWMQTNGADTQNQQGTFVYNSNETALPTAAGRTTSGNPFASFLLGAVDSATYNGLFVVPGNRYRYIAAFINDDWKVTRKLTLNLGLRWDLYIPREEAHDNFASFDPSLANPGAGGHLGAVAFLGDGPGRISGKSSFADTDYKNFGPHIGFAYQPFKSTVLRGGYVIYYSQGNATAGLRTSQNFVYGLNASPSYASSDAGVTPAFYWDGGFPTNWPKPPFIDPTVQNGSNVNMIGKGDGRPPYFQNAQFSVQQMLASRMVIEAAYVGVKGTRLGNNLISLNQVNPVYLSLGATLTQNITSPTAAAAGIVAPYAGFTGSVAQALRPYPQYLNIIELANPNGNSTYHALQTKLTRRLSNGMTLLVSYTWSKSLSDGNVMAGGGPAGQDFYNRRLEKSLSTDDVPQNLSIAYTYELPFGPGKKFLKSGIASKIAGGWQFNGVQQYQTGKPVTLTANNTLPIFNGVLRPDVNLDVPHVLDHPNPLGDPWLNRNAFAVPQTFHFGNASREYTDMRAQNLSYEAFGLIRRVRVQERATVTIRAEFFNMFNRVVFGAPASNISSTGFGRVSSQANNPRQGQVSLRVDF